MIETRNSAKMWTMTSLNYHEKNLELGVEMQAICEEKSLDILKERENCKTKGRSSQCYETFKHITFEQ